MSAPFDSFIAAGVDLGCFGVIGSDGYLIGGGATAPDAGDQTGSGMVRVKGITAAAPTIAAPDVVNLGGDGISQGTFAFPSVVNPAFDLDKTVFDLVNDAIIQQTKVYAMGGFNLGVLKPSSNNPQDLVIILQSMTKKKDVGLTGLRAWSGFILPICNAYPLGRQAFTDRAGAADRWRVITTPADQLCNGIAIDSANFGTEGGCIIPFTNDWPMIFWRWTGDGTEDTYTLPVTPGEYSADQIVVTVDGVLQVWTTDYSASGTSLVFTSGHKPGASAKIEAAIGYNPNA